MTDEQLEKLLDAISEIPQMIKACTITMMAGSVNSTIDAEETRETINQNFEGA